MPWKAAERTSHGNWNSKPDDSLEQNKIGIHEPAGCKVNDTARMIFDAELPGLLVSAWAKANREKPFRPKSGDSFNIW